MIKPYIVCHMMTSVDGRIDCAMTEHLPGVQEYYDTLDALDAPTRISGRVTAELEMALPGKFEAKTAEALGKEAFSKAADAEGLFTHVTDLTGEWCATEQLPVALGVWVARKGTDLLQIEALEYALTFGLEHTFEAVRESVPDEALLEIYEHLSSEVDYLFDLEKHKALKRLWSSGVKNALRTNPG